MWKLLLLIFPIVYRKMLPGSEDQSAIRQVEQHAENTHASGGRLVGQLSYRIIILIRDVKVGLGIRGM